MPDGLYAFYDEILGRIQDARVRKDAFTTLRWVMFAARSFWLEDLVEACAVLPRAGQLFDKEARSHLHCLDLIEPLSGLIHVQPPLSEDEKDEPGFRTHNVTLAHFSVDEYLQQMDTHKWNISRTFFDRRDANFHISQACFAYLVHESENLEDTLYIRPEILILVLFFIRTS
jgi:hypothetical protein